ncbi:MAG: type II secretion system GspH family protein [Helicobacteraceae bacterium]|jgi:prepilin-type N-terminal cleavage/methylation domain-containing protein|nr:type II secretion system GspH family protein [Helicobacteraceae bacterium]
MRNDAFTLIELLIVLTIVGIIYATATAAIKGKEGVAGDGEWRLDTLTEALRAKEGYLKLVCGGDRCERCALMDIDGNTVEDRLALFEEIPIVHYYDRGGYLDRFSFKEGVCFEMERFENGSVTDMLVEHRSKFYRYYALLTQTAVYASFDEARETIDPTLWIPSAQAQYHLESD